MNCKNPAPAGAKPFSGEKDSDEPPSLMLYGEDPEGEGEEEDECEDHLLDEDDGDDEYETMPGIESWNPFKVLPNPPGM